MRSKMYNISNFNTMHTHARTHVRAHTIMTNVVVYLQFKWTSVCSLVAGGGRFPFFETVAMLLLAWHVKRAVPIVRCRWLIIGCHLVRLVNNKLLTVTLSAAERFDCFLR